MTFILYQQNVTLRCIQVSEDFQGFLDFYFTSPKAKPLELKQKLKLYNHLIYKPVFYKPLFKPAVCVSIVV